MNEEERLRAAYDMALGDGSGAAWRTRVETELDPFTGRAVHNRPYEYTPEELQAAMDISNTDNAWRAGIFNEILRRTDNPRMATAATALADYSPGIGTALAIKDAEMAARYLNDNWADGDYGALAGNLGLIGLAGLDAAATLAPFAGPGIKGLLSLGAR